MPTQFRRARIGWRLQSTPVPSEATPVGVLPTQLSRPRTRAQCPLNVCAVQRRRFPVGASPTRPNAPAGSNRSSHGGNEMAEAFGVAGHVSVTARVCGPQRE